MARLVKGARGMELGEVGDQPAQHSNGAAPSHRAVVFAVLCVQ
jgi:hypothetical protein